MTSVVEPGVWKLDNPILKHTQGDVAGQILISTYFRDCFLNLTENIRRYLATEVYAAHLCSKRWV